MLLFAPCSHTLLLLFFFLVVGVVNVLLFSGVWVLCCSLNLSEPMGLVWWCFLCRYTYVSPFCSLADGVVCIDFVTRQGHAVQFHPTPYKRRCVFAFAHRRLWARSRIVEVGEQLYFTFFFFPTHTHTTSRNANKWTNQQMRQRGTAS